MKKKKEIVLLVILLIILILMILGFTMYKKIPKKIENESKTKEQILEEQGVNVRATSSFVSDANSLLEKGYSASTINDIYDNLSERNISILLTMPYTDITEFMSIPNLSLDKLNRYKAYMAKENISASDAVTRVNLNLDEEFYKTVNDIKDPSSILVLVNKSHALKSDYVPSDLVAIPSFPNLLLRQVAIDDFESLLAAAKLDNVYLIPYSTYRSYDYQKGLYEKYLKEDSQEVVDTYSARPGHSEHQTGLAIDIRSSSHWYSLTDNDYDWMLNNSYKYGFIVRYPKNNSQITGYKEEPWHIRYLGRDIATKVHDKNPKFQVETGICNEKV